MGGAMKSMLAKQAAGDADRRQEQIGDTAEQRPHNVECPRARRGEPRLKAKLCFAGRHEAMIELAGPSSKSGSFESS
jgi:hypothetical protein